MQHSIQYLIAFLFLWSIATGCKTTGVIVPDQFQPEHKLIYLIHGDADYLYFDGQGQELQADKKVLKEAHRVAKEMVSSEVFIFHQRRERKWLGIIPRKDRNMWHYRNGKLVESQSYSPEQDSLSFLAEAALYRKYSNTTASAESFLFYFGHEIPRINGENYDRSRTKVELNALKFTEGIASFLPRDSEKFELIVLSTCNNGTPAMVHLLEPIANTLLASPQNLHLSHIDTKAIGMIEKGTPVQNVAVQMAENTFERLSESIQTEISLSVYDLNLINLTDESFFSDYQNYLVNTQPNKPDQNTDCAKVFLSGSFDYSTGVQSWYRPAQFGRRASVNSHSGWGCELREKVE